MLAWRLYLLKLLLCANLLFNYRIADDRAILAVAGRIAVKTTSVSPRRAASISDKCG
jgi:hypothetical protein